jgi:hypothetical protein
MKNNNQIFFEEYKRLDKLLKEASSSDVGVTAYIDEFNCSQLHNIFNHRLHTYT